MKQNLKNDLENVLNTDENWAEKSIVASRFLNDLIVSYTLQFLIVLIDNYKL